MSPESDHPSYLAFHKLAENYPFESTCYPVERFEGLLYDLIAAGFSLWNGERGEVVISFDDGYAHLADSLPNLIDRFAFQPLIFVPTFWIGQDNRWDFSHKIKAVEHLLSEQIEMLVTAGCRFGSHGHSHTNLRQLTDRELEAELVISREILQDLTHQPIDSISYPFGRADDRVVNAARKAGYKRGLTMAFPSGSDTDLTIGRYAVYSWDSSKTVIRKLRRGRGFWWEKAKARLTNLASAGTFLFKRPPK